MLNWLDKDTTISEMNKLGQINCPFLFVIGFEMNQNLVIKANEIDQSQVRFHFPKSPDVNYHFENKHYFDLEICRPDYSNYKQAYELVKDEILKGNSFLTNLTISSEISGEINLKSVYKNAESKYKLWIDDMLVCFSPEGFVHVNESGRISSFPMKGTINAKVNYAKEKILNDKKELFEHTTIVDLIRNDLSIICENVWVERFRFIDEIKKQNGEILLQVSSEICGQLPKNWKNILGNWFFKLLPAGSILGAPKDKTLDIISKAEENLHYNGKRGLYTGIMGYFDGNTLDSAVMIRYMEKINSQYVYKSGGGITFKSEVQKEFEEIMEKIYVPVL